MFDLKYHEIMLEIYWLKYEMLLPVDLLHFIVRSQTNYRHTHVESLVEQVRTFENDRNFPGRRNYRVLDRYDILQ